MPSIRCAPRAPKLTGSIDDTEDDNGNGRHDGTTGGTGDAGQGETDPLDPDSDDDGLLDGTELGLITPEGLHTDPAIFVPDADPLTTTDPMDRDTDDGSVSEGIEDEDLNGRIDPGERDPKFGDDDLRSDEAIDVDQFKAIGGGGCTGGEAGLIALFVAVGLALGRRRSRCPDRTSLAGSAPCARRARAGHTCRRRGAASRLPITAVRALGGRHAVICGEIHHGSHHRRPTRAARLTTIVPRSTQR